MVGLARKLPGWIGRKLASSFDQAWYLLDLDRVEPRPLADGYELRLAGERELGWVTQLVEDSRAEQAAAASSEASSKPRTMDVPGFSPEEMLRRRQAGAQLWVAVNDDEAAFACWIFPRVAPMVQASGGIFELPDAVACLEDSLTSANHRGRGIAPAAWAAIAERLSDDGFELMITKVAVENVPSRRAVEKAGFRGATVIEYRRRGPRVRVSFQRLDPGELTARPKPRCSPSWSAACGAEGQPVCSGPPALSRRTRPRRRRPRSGFPPFPRSAPGGPRSVR